MGYLGAREREHLARQQFLEKVTRLLQFDRGFAESIRQALGEIALASTASRPAWPSERKSSSASSFGRVRPSEREPHSPEMLPPTRSETFLADSLEVSMCWDFREWEGEGFGWDRRTGQHFQRHSGTAESPRSEEFAQGPSWP